MSLTLPWPPSNNTYYRHVGNRVLLSSAGRAYRADVVAALASQITPRFGQHVRVSLTVTACAPDRRRRDLDNLGKAICDALTFAGVYADDSQIDRLVFERGKVHAGGRLLVQIVPLSETDKAQP